MRKYLFLGLAGWLWLSGLGVAAPLNVVQLNLSTALAKIAEREQPGALAVAVIDLQTGDEAGVNSDQAMPMQSVFKAPLAALVLSKVDAGELSLDREITLTRADLSPPFSPIAEQWAARRTYTVAELIERTAGASDNTAADVLMRLVGGPAAINAFLTDHGVEGLQVDRYERELQPESLGMRKFKEAWLGNAAFTAAKDAVPEATRRRAQLAYLKDTRDTATPEAAAQFMRKLVMGELLSSASTARLVGILTRTTTGPARLKAGLPANAVLVHKTGTGWTDLGTAVGVNDVGVVTYANGRRVVIASFLKSSTSSEAARDQLHADVARAVTAALEQ